MVRIAAYCLLYQAIVWAFVSIHESIGLALAGTLGKRVAGLCFFFTAVSVLLVGFMFIWDAMKFAHRIVGPLVRFRQTVLAITAGEDVDLIRLRQGDSLQELKDEFNEMLRVLEQRGAVVL